jgi:hypothetical protein
MPEGVGYGPQDTASVGKNLNVIGNHAYAHSGLIQINTAEVLHLEFTTGQYLLVGPMQFQGATKADDPATGKSSIFTVNFNGIAVAGVKVDSAVEGMPSVINLDFVIPPYTVVVVTCRSPATTAGLDTAVIMSGRIYK